MLRIAIAATLAFLPFEVASAQSVGACAWIGAPAATRTRFLSAYQEDMKQGMGVLASADADLTASFEHCAGRKDIPKLWVQGAIGSNAIQSGSAAELLEARHLARDSLDAAWTEAPEAARECTRANAQKVFGLSQATCSDPRAPLWFLQRFAISPQTERPVAGELLTYYDAKAQDEWVEALIKKFRTQTPISAR